MGKKSDKPTIEAYDDSEWKAKSDYRTLCSAAEIIDDKKRYDAAIKAGEKERDEMDEMAELVDGLRKDD